MCTHQVLRLAADALRYRDGATCGHTLAHARIQSVASDHGVDATAAVCLTLHVYGDVSRLSETAVS